jgi:outer membrane protein TolC
VEQRHSHLQSQFFAFEGDVAKTKSDITFEIRRAYFNMVKAQRSLRVRRELNQRTEKIIEVSRKKKQLGLITQADALGAESLYSQSYYRLLSDEKELEIARLKLSALLNTNDPLPEVVPEPKETTDSRTLLELSVPPESLIQLGMSHRPELLISEYTAAAQHFAARSALGDFLEPSPAAPDTDGATNTFAAGDAILALAPL